MKLHFANLQFRNLYISISLPHYGSHRVIIIRRKSIDVDVMNYARLEQSSSIFATYLREYSKGAFCSPSFSTDPISYAIIFLDVYDFALMSAVDEAPVLSERLSDARHVIGHRARRIRLGLAVLIDDNPRERSRGRRTSRIIKAVSFVKEMPEDTVTRLWRLHRGIITVAMARVDGEREEQKKVEREGEPHRVREGAV